MRISVGAFMPAAPFQAIASRASRRSPAGSGPTHRQTLPLGGVCVNRTSMVTSTIRYEIQTVTAIMYVMIVTVIFIVSYGHPFFPSDVAPRACVVPIVFGSFVFIGTFLAWLGSKISMPVLSMSIIGAFSVTGMNMHFHDVRTIASERNGFSKRQIDIGYAVQKWKIDAKVFEFVAEQEFARSDFAWRLPPVF